MSDTTDIEQTLEYQEQILDDLDDIKGSLDEESEYYDKKYQKEVLSSLKSLQKSVDSLNESDPVVLEYLSFIAAGNHVTIGSSTVSDSGVINLYYNSFSSPQPKIFIYDVSDYIDISIICPESYTDVNGFTTDTLYDNLTGSDHPVVGNFFKSQYGTYELGDPDFDYLYLQLNSGSWDISYTVKGVYSPSGGDDPLPEEPVEVVTTSSAVIIEGLDNLTQITTFQSFCSSLLIGIMLFLVFVKGLRK